MHYTNSSRGCAPCGRYGGVAYHRVANCSGGLVKKTDNVSPILLVDILLKPFVDSMSDVSLHMDCALVGGEICYISEDRLKYSVEGGAGVYGGGCGGLLVILDNSRERVADSGYGARDRAWVGITGEWSARRAREYREVTWGGLQEDVYGNIASVGLSPLRESATCHQNGVFDNEVYGSDSKGFGMNPLSNEFRLCNNDEWRSRNHGGRVIIRGYGGGGDMVVRHGLKGCLDHRILRSSPIIPPHQ
ncbi:hypothetical protein Tco_0797128 [Tanacetum coccineum]